MSRSVGAQETDADRGNVSRVLCLYDYRTEVVSLVGWFHIPLPISAVLRKHRSFVSLFVGWFHIPLHHRSPQFPSSTTRCGQHGAGAIRGSGEGAAGVHGDGEPEGGDPGRHLQAHGHLLREVHHQAGHALALAPALALALALARVALAHDERTRTPSSGTSSRSD